MMKTKRPTFTGPLCCGGCLCCWRRRQSIFQKQQAVKNVAPFLCSTYYMLLLTVYIGFTHMDANAAERRNLMQKSASAYSSISNEWSCTRPALVNTEYDNQRH